MNKEGTLTPECIFEFDYSNYERNSISSEEDLFEILKDFLWERTEIETEPYLVLDLYIEKEDGEIFEQNLIEKETPLIPDPTDKEPFQLIHEHTLEDASYLFNYFDDDSPLDVEFETYDNGKLLFDIKQAGESCEYESQGDGGTADQFVTFRFLDKTGEIQSLRSAAFAQLPLELNEDNEDEYIQNVKEVAKNFFKNIT